MVQLSIGDEWSLPSIQAIDNVDGDISHLVEANLLSIQEFLVEGIQYHFTTKGNYPIYFTVSDAAGNTATLTLTIVVSEPDYNWSSIPYYESLSTSTDVLTDLALLLRSTISYVTYGDARYVYATYDNGSQAVLYDIPSSNSYGKVPATGLDGWGTNGVINGDGYTITLNREHVWACSDMRIMPYNGSRTLSSGYVNFVLNDGSFDYRPDNSNRGHFTDLHNLWNAIASVNNTHSDHFFGEENGASVAPYLANNIFYPGDEYKGDIARILFYMTLMYPHLTLVETNDANAQEGSVYYGYLEILLQRNEEDPVNDMEMRRNETIYLEQGNRNPFIDFYSEQIVDFVFANGDPNIAD